MASTGTARFSIHIKRKGQFILCSLPLNQYFPDSPPFLGFLLRSLVYLAFRRQAGFNPFFFILIKIASSSTGFLMISSLSSRQLKSNLRPLVRPVRDFIKKARHHARRLSLYPIRLLPFHSEQFGPPKGFYIQPTEFCKEETGSYQEIFASQSLTRHPAQSLDASPHWMLKEQEQHVSPPAYLLKIPNGRFWTWYSPRGEVGAMAFLSQADKVIGGVSYGFGYLEKVNHSKVFTLLNLGTPFYRAGKVVVLTSIMAEQFFHWMIDILPKFRMLEEAGVEWDSIDAFVVNRVDKPFIEQTLAILGIKSPRLITSIEYPYIKADELIAVSPPCYVANPTPWMVDFLRTTFIPHIPELKSPERIYISRSKANRRILLNEADLHPILEEYGFEIVHMEEIPLLEQMAYFSNAKVIMGPHGAGFTNLPFAEPTTKLIEFFSPQYINICYYNLSNLLDVDYYYLEGEGYRPPEGVNLSLGTTDIRVDIDKVRQLLEKAAVHPK